ncbi:MAG: hypothetical protein DBX55_04695 [Verrucomicrobia bacterium]|nr:MAG: hypothetical protein DBX55_04695 [Verrucomicrobiota bacterium]
MDDADSGNPNRLLRCVVLRRNPRRDWLARPPYRTAISDRLNFGRLNSSCEFAKNPPKSERFPYTFFCEKPRLQNSARFWRPFLHEWISKVALNFAVYFVGYCEWRLPPAPTAAYGQSGRPLFGSNLSAAASFSPDAKRPLPKRRTKKGGRSCAKGR